MAHYISQRIERTTNYITQALIYTAALFNKILSNSHHLHVYVHDDVTVGDNYAPAVSQIFLDAVTDPAYLYLPRMQLEVHNPVRASPYMSLMAFLFSAGTRSAGQVNTLLCCVCSFSVVILLLT